MSSGNGGGARTRREVHFSSRVIRCYADRPAGIHMMLRAAAEAHPDGDAVIDGSVRLSHAGLGRMVEHVAAGLAGRGLQPGDRLVLLVGNSWQFVAALLGGMRAGLIVVPVSIRSQTPELAYVLQDCAAAAVICDSAYSSVVPPPAGVPSLRMVIETDSPDFTALTRHGTAQFTSPPPAEEDTAVILYTSGTTGEPKGAMLTHLNLVHSCLHFIRSFALSAADRSLMAVPATHVTGLVANILTILGAGGALLVLPAFDVAAFLDLAARERMTHTVMVPAMYNLCLLRADLREKSLDHWRIGGFGGAPMPERTIARFAEQLPALHLCNAYGATETTSPATIMAPGVTHRPDSVGRAVTCGDIRIMNADGIEVPAGEAGEIWIAGPMVVPGYWNKPDKTAESFTGGYWRSGDIGSCDADGFVKVFDRLKDMINRGGYKIFSAEVENVLTAHDSVSEVAVVPQVDPVLGERVHAFVCLKGGATADAAALQAFCARRLSDYKVPDGFTFCSEPLPRNANGKLMKRDLRLRISPHD